MVASRQAIGALGDLPRADLLISPSCCRRAVRPFRLRLDSCDLPVHDLAILLPPNIAALPPVADSCDLPVHDLAIMLPPNIAALSPVADSCDLPVHDLAIMLPRSIAALSPVVDSCDLPVHDLAIMLPPNIAAFPPVADSCDLPVYDHVPFNLPIQFGLRFSCRRARVVGFLGRRVVSKHEYLATRHQPILRQILHGRMRLNNYLVSTAPRTDEIEQFLDFDDDGSIVVVHVLYQTQPETVTRSVSKS
jgi:hypothetical protein